MKTMVILLLALLNAGAVFSQDAANTAEPPGKKTNKTDWVCPACFKISKEAGACTQDKTATIQLGSYYCQRCVKASGGQPGQCRTCNGTTTQMTKKLCKQHKEPVKKIA
jgi:hypothetical protein